jgi:hypothetical protein
MGVGPCSTRAGDETVLLFGSPLCFVLRPDDDGYKFVGDAYIQGVNPYSFPATQDGKELLFRDFIIH